MLEDGDAIQGFLIARAVGPEWELENIAIAGSARRRGLGTRLLGEFLNTARARGATSVFLEVRESNSAARRLYEKWAFSKVAAAPPITVIPQRPPSPIDWTFPDCTAAWCKLHRNPRNSLITLTFSYEISD